MRIILNNLASVEYCDVDLGEKGLVQFVGRNSDGKSIIPYAIEYIGKGHYKDPKRRKSFINRESDCGYCIIIRNDGVAIKYTVFPEKVDNTLYWFDKYEDERSTPTIRRSLREGGWEELLAQFGFKSYANGELCLQVAELFGKMPFINQSYKANAELIEDMCKDHLAQKFLVNFKEVTEKKLREQAKIQKSKVDTYQKMLENLEYHDVDECAEIYVQLKEMRDLIYPLKLIQLDKLVIPPNVNVIDVPIIKIRQLPLPVFVPTLNPMHDLTQQIKDMNLAKINICPVCGQEIKEGHCDE